MTPVIWILALAVFLLLVALAVVGYPLFFQPLEPYLLADLPDETFNERDALLEAMNDLEQSHRAGRISPEDYQSVKKELETRYIQVVEHPGSS